MRKDWLHAENLLPHQTVEKLTKWTVYDDEGQARTVPAQNGRGPWESDDPTQEMLESRLVNTRVSAHTPRPALDFTGDAAAACFTVSSVSQVAMPGSRGAVEVDEVEDLSQLE